MESNEMSLILTAPYGTCKTRRRPGKLKNIEKIVTKIRRSTNSSLLQATARYFHCKEKIIKCGDQHRVTKVVRTDINRDIDWYFTDIMIETSHFRNMH